VKSTGRRNTSTLEVADGDDARASAGIPALSRADPVTGRPTVAWRQDRVRFWAAIARGLKTDDAGVEAGVSSPVASLWFRHAGGVNPCLPPTVTGRYLSFSKREDIANGQALKLGVRESVRRLNRSASTISRELRRMGLNRRAFVPRSIKET